MKMKIVGQYCLGLVATTMLCASAAGQVLYRETFPASPADDRGQNVLDQGWDVIRSRLDQLTDVVAGTAPDGMTEVGQNSSAIFGNGDTTPEGDIGGGVNNNPFTPDDTGDGILFASSGFYPFLFFTDSEVPAGTQASDVGSVRFRMRNNDARTEDPLDQSIHPVLKVDGQWYVNDQGRKNPDNSVFRIYATDLSQGNWAELDVTQLDFTAGTIDTAQIVSDFNLSKPSGTVEGWGLYNALLTANTRFDFIEFRSDNLEIVPEPTSLSLLLASCGVVVAGRRQRR